MVRAFGGEEAHGELVQLAVDALDEDLLGLPLASAALLEELGDIPHVTYHAGNVRKRGRG